MNKILIATLLCLSLNTELTPAIDPGNNQPEHVDAIAELNWFNYDDNDIFSAQAIENVNNILRKALPQQLPLIIQDDYFPEWIRNNAQRELVRRDQIRIIANLIAQAVH